jgi:DMSO/TMAO reductase YedYZ molybdopterin-dependent catalytic subunit
MSNAGRRVRAEIVIKRVIFNVLFIVVALVAQTGVLGQNAPRQATSLVVDGNVENRLSLTVADLRRLPVQQVEDVRQVRVAGAPSAESGATRRYAGVLLRDVIAAAKPVERERHDLRRSIVVATATDGYQAVFSWAELFLSPIGDGAMVVFERDGAPLTASEGPFAIVSLKDTQPGPRHVKWLERLDLRRVEN